MSDTLALLGGKPIRTASFAPWPQHLPADALRVQQVVESRLSEALTDIKHVRPLPPQPSIAQTTHYCYVFQYRPDGQGVSRDIFAAALDAEGVPCDGRFYEAVYRSDLFYASPEISPQLKSTDYTVAERAAYDEALWLPQTVLIGEEDDINDVVRAVDKVARNLDFLRKADPKLAGVKAMSRSQRPRYERRRNY